MPVGMFSCPVTTGGLFKFITNKHQNIYILIGLLLNSGMNLFLDIETTGLIPKGADWRTGYNDFPYILSIAVGRSPYDARQWYLNNEGMITLEDEEGNTFEPYKGAIKVNRITQEIIDKKGVLAKKALKHAVIALGLAEKVIGHNIYFDSSIIKANVLRYFGPNSHEAKCIEEALHKDKRIDTVRLAQKKFGGKYMSLEDLYYKLFGERYDGAHNALNDVIALQNVYNKLIEL